MPSHSNSIALSAESIKAIEAISLARHDRGKEPDSLAVRKLYAALKKHIVKQLTIKFQLNTFAAEEVAQDTLLAFMTSSVPSGVKPVDWYLRLLKAKAYDHLRGMTALKRRASPVDTDVDEYRHLKASEPTDDDALPVELYVDIGSAFERFRFEQPQHAELLNLLIEGYRPDEIAGLYELDPTQASSIRAIKDRMIRARKVARRYFEDYSDDEIYKTRQALLESDIGAKPSREELTILSEIHQLATNSLKSLQQSRKRIEEKELRDPRQLFVFNGGL